MTTPDFRFKRLGHGDREQAQTLFTLMAAVFEEVREPLSDVYLDRLLGNGDFWAIAAFAGPQIVGGITAHSLPMTRTASSELFIFDLAVDHAWQRQGIGRGLVGEMQFLAAAEGIAVCFVAADNDDSHALDFYRALGGDAAPVTLFTFTR